MTSLIKNCKKKIINNFGKVDFVTSHNTLAHVDDIKSIFENIYTILKNDGHFCFEIGYFKEVPKKIYLIQFITST